MFRKFFLVSDSTPACFNFSFSLSFYSTSKYSMSVLSSFLLFFQTQRLSCSSPTSIPQIFIHPNFLSPQPMKLFPSHLDDCKSCFPEPPNPPPSLHGNKRIVSATVQQVPKNQTVGDSEI